MRTLATMLVFAMACGTVICNAQDPHADPAAMQKMWEDFAMVGPEHEMMKAHVGSWKTVTKDFMMNPNQPDVTEGKSEFELVMDGRFLMQHFHGKSQGKPFEGMGMTGYDRGKKKYVGTWVDNMGTGIMATEGTYDPATHSMTEMGSMSSPMGEMKLKMVTKHVSETEFVFTMYMMTPNGGESKAMEITYTKM